MIKQDTPAVAAGHFIEGIKTRNLYAMLLSLQILDVFNSLVVGEMIREGMIGLSPVVHGAMQFSIILVLNCIVLMVLYRLMKGSALFYLYAAAVLVSIGLMSVSESPLQAGFDPSGLKTVRFLALGFQLFSLTFMCLVIMQDIFSRKHELFYSLTGAASIFILIGTIFGVMYALLEVWAPGAICGPGQTNILKEALTYSFFVISGQDPPVTEVHSVVRHLSIFESIFSNLYAVIVVGRLLSK